MSDINNIQDKLLKFRDDRDWSQFHNPKDLALAISIEAGELLEQFLWKDSSAADKQKVTEEIADIQVYLMLLAEKYDLDLMQIVDEKIDKNSKKYPIGKAKGSAKKYTEL